MLANKQHFLFQEQIKKRTLQVILYTHGRVDKSGTTFDAAWRCTLSADFIDNNHDTWNVHTIEL